MKRYNNVSSPTDITISYYNYVQDPLPAPALVDSFVTLTPEQLHIEAPTATVPKKAELGTVGGSHLQLQNNSVDPSTSANIPHYFLLNVLNAQVESSPDIKAAFRTWLDVGSIPGETQSLDDVLNIGNTTSNSIHLVQITTSGT